MLSAAFRSEEVFVRADSDDQGVCSRYGPSCGDDFIAG